MKLYILTKIIFLGGIGMQIKLLCVNQNETIQHLKQLVHLCSFRLRATAA
jgi:hypothetical protein